MNTTAPKEKTAAPVGTGTTDGNTKREQDATSGGTGKPIDLAALGEETVADYYHAPSERFLVRNPAGRWLPYGSSSYRRILAGRGVAVAREKGVVLSEADHVMLDVQTNNDVSRYGPLCGRNAGFFDEGGIRHLVTEGMKLIEPVPGHTPTIHRILAGLLVNGEDADVGNAQIHSFLGWMKSSVVALRAGRPQQQQALAIAGPPDCGKSVLQHFLITPALAGRSADAHRYFLRDNDFNSELFAVEHLTLDDCAASTRISDRLAFGARLKGVAVGSAVKSCHGKGRDAVNLRPWWRLTITCNDDPEALMVLPPLNTDIEDKITLLHASRFDFPHAMETSEDRELFAEIVAGEMPGFLHWLLNTYQIPPEFGDRRYNVSTYHHPDLRAAIDGLSPEAELLDLIDDTLADDLACGPVWIRAEELESRIRGSHHRRAEMVFTYRQACAKYLQRLSAKHPDRVAKSRTSTANGWLIQPKSPESGECGG